MPLGSTGLVFSLERFSKGTLSRVRSKLQQIVIRISSQVKCITAIINLEDESTESKKVFYLFSLMLLISLILLSPDKILQTFTPSQTDIGILEKAQEITRIIKKLISNMG